MEAADWRPLYFGPAETVRFASLETKVPVAATFTE